VAEVPRYVSEARLERAMKFGTGKGIDVPSVGESAAAFVQSPGLTAPDSAAPLTLAVPALVPGAADLLQTVAPLNRPHVLDAWFVPWPRVTRWAGSTRPRRRAGCGR